MGDPIKERAEIELSDHERFLIHAERERFQDAQPTPDDLIGEGDIDEPVPHGQFMELLSLVDQIKRARERGGLSLTELSRRSGLTRAVISRLENGWNNNPTLDTLYRYALGVGLHIKLAVEPVARPEESPEGTSVSIERIILSETYGSSSTDTTAADRDETRPQARHGYVAEPIRRRPEDPRDAQTRRVRQSGGGDTSRKREPGRGGRP